MNKPKYKRVYIKTLNVHKVNININTHTNIYITYVQPFINIFNGIRLTTAITKLNPVHTVPNAVTQNMIQVPANQSFCKCFSIVCTEQQQ